MDRPEANPFLRHNGGKCSKKEATEPCNGAKTREQTVGGGGTRKCTELVGTKERKRKIDRVGHVVWKSAKDDGKGGDAHTNPEKEKKGRGKNSRGGFYILKIPAERRGKPVRKL